ncbi:hypothetical protein, partial [Micromonospora sp. RTGN7]|uniref:hypothetical protein n=1 Tax=Micromonospora sp. RTGN7 TaxID=3016526 RepID=UPI0029FF0C2A
MTAGIVGAEHRPARGGYTWQTIEQDTPPPPAQRASEPANPAGGMRAGHRSLHLDPATTTP